MKVDTKGKERTAFLTIMVLSQLCHEIKLITARSSKSRHQQNSSQTEVSSQESQGWNFPQLLNRFSRSVKDDSAVSDKEYDTLPQVDGVSAGTHPQLLKHWLNLEKVPLPHLPVKLHSDFTLECEAVGSPPPIVYWTKNGKYLKASAHKSEMKYLNHIHGPFSEQSETKISSTSFGRENKGLRLGGVTSKLPLRCIRPEDEAEYSCVADNGGKKVMASTTLVIEEDDPSGNVTPECELRLLNFMSHKKKKPKSPAYIMSWETFHMERIGNDIMLPCNSGGHPRPKIRWTGNEGQEIVSDNKFYVSPKGNFFIKNLSWNEMGEYTCMVSNAFGSDVVTTFLYPLMDENQG